jgi:hypothetical protein
MPNLMQQMPGMPMQNNMGMSGGQFPGPSASPVSANPPQSPMSQQAQMYALNNIGQNNGGGGGGGGGGMDPRSMLPPGMNINNLTPIQRQQLMLMQQSRFNNSNMNPAQMGSQQMNPTQMSPQQVAYAQQQQERMREQQRLAQLQASGMGTPQGSASPMPGGDTFPALRSNSAIPGIARSTRSPSDGAQSPMTPRVPTRGSSMGQEDYQRLMAQQQAQASRAMAARSPVYSQHQQQQQIPSGWQQQGMQINPSSSYGMSPPPSAGPYGGGPSPSNNQNWSQQGQGGYPFASSPGSGHQPDHMQQIRHMSGTPGPQQQMQPQNTSPPAEQSNEFDIFSWAT